MYKISRAMKMYGQITPAQRTSGLFAEEPTVAGKTLRRNGPDMFISEETYNAFKGKIKLLEKAGSIKVEKVINEVPKMSTKEEPLDVIKPVVETPVLTPEIIQEEPKKHNKAKMHNKR